MILFFLRSFAQTAVVLAVLIKTKDKKLKSLAIPAFISGFFGVTEPAIYGITLPKKKPFIISCIAAGIGGAIIGGANVKVYMLGGLGVFGFPSFIDSATNDATSMVLAGIAVLISMVIAFILTFVLYKEDVQAVSTNHKTNAAAQLIAIASPVKGKVKDLSQVEDEAFASGALGKGVAVVPSEGKIVAPCDGEIVTFFPTGHAFGLLSDTGVEVLVHVGLDTVKLNGKYFTAKAKQGDKVKKGQVLLEVDFDGIKSEGYATTTPVVITNADDYTDIIFETNKNVNCGDDLISLL
jgi:PTS system beta-glucosides-specific IIC component